ncbi:MAG: hypothetical protein K8F27_12130, partial [Sulfuricellaceae bacterium]|nr:hypothetical protein [Sulfuricellaceae bacterium]
PIAAAAVKGTLRTTYAHKPPRFSAKMACSAKNYSRIARLPHRVNPRISIHTIDYYDFLLGIMPCKFLMHRLLQICKLLSCNIFHSFAN